MHSEYAAMWQQDLAYRKVKIFTYGNENSQCYLESVTKEDELIIHTTKGQIRTKLQVLGQHNQVNAVTAAALALTINCSIENIAQGLASFMGYKGRLEQKTAFNDALIIDDSYNANPDSVKAAILAISKLAKPHWFILGDLAELGELSNKLHKEVGQFASENGIDILLTVGNFAKIAGEHFTGKHIHFNFSEELVKYCKEFLPNNAVLLIKGSKVSKLGDVVTQLIKV